MHFQFIHLIYPIRRAYTLTIESVFSGMCLTLLVPVLLPLIMMFR